jgi:hypothetical protein
LWVEHARTPLQSTQQVNFLMIWKLNFQLWTINELCNKLWEAEMGGQETLLVAQRGSGDTVCYLCKDQMICILSLKDVRRWFHFLSHGWLFWKLFERYVTLSRRRSWMLHHLTFEALLFWASIW